MSQRRLTTVDGTVSPVVREVGVLGLAKLESVAVGGEEPVAVKVLFQLHKPPHVDAEQSQGDHHHADLKNQSDTTRS